MFVPFQGFRRRRHLVVTGEREENRKNGLSLSLKSNQGPYVAYLTCGQIQVIAL